MKKPKAQIHIELATAKWGQVMGLTGRLNKAAAATLQALPGTLQAAAGLAEMTLLLTTDKAVQELNHDYRGKDMPTNVLSFPQYEKADLIKAAKRHGPLDGPIYAGDIAIAYQYVVKEAKAEGKKLHDHVVHLMIHGILHLFGYDHMNAAQAARMEKLEKEIMASLGLPDPYAEIEAVKPAKAKTRAPKPKARKKA